MDEGKYLSEVSGRLRRAGFTVEQDERLASISLDSQPLCQINGSGGVRRGIQADEHLNAACDRAVDIVRTTAAYTRERRNLPKRLCSVSRMWYSVGERGAKRWEIRNRETRENV